LLLEIQKADAEVRRVNAAAPRDALTGPYLRSVEEEARGHSSGNAYTIMRNLRPPAWRTGKLPVWPPHRPMALALMPPIPGGDRRRYTGDWWKVKEDEARATQERQAREAAEREAKAGENWHGPRWWERERT